MEKPAEITPTRLKAEVGISLSYASELLSGRHEPGNELAVRIWRKTGLKLGRLRGCSDEKVEGLARFFDGIAA